MSHCANEITELVIFVARQSVDINFELWHAIVAMAISPPAMDGHGAMELAVAMPDASKVQPLQAFGLGQPLFAASSCRFMSKH